MSPAHAVARQGRYTLPWSEFMAVGLGQLGLSPRDFWSMTLVEFGSALAGLYGPGSQNASLTRIELDELLRRFPDKG